MSSDEVRIPCPTCGKRKMDVNTRLWVYHCFVCGASGKGVPSTYAGQRAKKVRRKADGLDLVEKMPEEAALYVQRRGMDLEDLVRRFGVRWDRSSGRIAWPAGEDCWSLRGVRPWSTPKCLTHGAPKGLIGQNELDSGQEIVIVEGDFKAAAIPAPWTPLGLLGAHLTSSQFGTLASHCPRSVTVLLDGGFEVEARAIAAKFWAMPTRVVALPLGLGPDDVPRSELVRLLLEG